MTSSWNLSPTPTLKHPPFSHSGPTLAPRPFHTRNRSPQHPRPHHSSPPRNQLNPPHDPTYASTATILHPHTKGCRKWYRYVAATASATRAGTTISQISTPGRTLKPRTRTSPYHHPSKAISATYATPLHSHSHHPAQLHTASLANHPHLPQPTAHPLPRPSPLSPPSPTRPLRSSPTIDHDPPLETQPKIYATAREAASDSKTQNTTGQAPTATHAPATAKDASATISTTTPTHAARPRPHPRCIPPLPHTRSSSPGHPPPLLYSTPSLHRGL